VPDSLRITHPERVYWPAPESYPAISKRQLLEYVAALSAYLLPHLRDRPLTLRRFPTALSGKRYYQKHVEFSLPSFVDRALIFAEEHGTGGYHVICNNVETLLWLAQIGNLELDDIYPTEFRLATVADRLANVGDVWGDLLNRKNDLTAAAGTWNTLG